MWKILYMEFIVQQIIEMELRRGERWCTRIYVVTGLTNKLYINTPKQFYYIIFDTNVESLQKIIEE